MDLSQARTFSSSYGADILPFAGCGPPSQVSLSGFFLPFVFADYATPLLPFPSDFRLARYELFPHFLWWPFPPNLNQGTLGHRRDVARSIAPDTTTTKRFSPLGFLPPVYNKGEHDTTRAGSDVVKKLY